MRVREGSSETLPLIEKLGQAGGAGPTGQAVPGGRGYGLPDDPPRDGPCITPLSRLEECVKQVTSDR